VRLSRRTPALLIQAYGVFGHELFFGGLSCGAAEYFVDLSETVAPMAAGSEHRGEFSFTCPPSDRGRPDAEKGSDFTRSKKRSIGRKVREVGRQRDMPIYSRRFGR
jgi:hypothetical protein